MAPCQLHTSLNPWWGIPFLSWHLKFWSQVDSKECMWLWCHMSFSLVPTAALFPNPIKKTYSVRLINFKSIKFIFLNIILSGKQRTELSIPNVDWLALGYQTQFSLHMAGVFAYWRFDFTKLKILLYIPTFSLSRSSSMSTFRRNLKLTVYQIKHWVPWFRVVLS